MKRLIIVFLAVMVNCATKSSSKLSEMNQKTEIFISESNGGADKPGFRVVKDKQELQNIAKSSFLSVDMDKEPKLPEFPTDKKVVLYNLGEFRSGDHRITQIKSLSVKDNVLYVEVPQYISGGMEIQVISNPWLIFTVPLHFQFNSVQLKYSK
ncbi:hypothetical protein D1632_14570 [Chryseobacterium nematophagum]|uniref:Protease complex subunit PrcB family protein n=1 Tax=Chryseobacterium nematophagum TaxID=2305228 RepID=A0A3M7L7Q8_9FLAO|nr:hypothetical protein [Chryseobacterium nematophagum]RMZ58801.1 hypothetical protein D1632_14570 [Chryseobacterium nematophagum]